MIDRIRDRLAGKARWYDIIEVSGAGTPISFANSRLHSVTERHNSGYGVRVNVEGKTGFSYTNDASRLEETADRALLLAAWGDTDDFELPARAKKGFEPYDDAIDDFDAAGEIAAAEETIAAILRRFPQATVDISLGRSTGSMRIVNSSGLDRSFRSSQYAVSVGATLILDDGTRIEAGESASFLAPAPHASLRERVMEKIGAALVTRKLPSGRVPVLLSPRAFARIIGIVTAGLSAKAVWKGISPFGEKRGERMFAPSLTVRDDPALAGSPYSYPFDDEGVTAMNKLLVDRGAIGTFITDLKHARKLDIVPGGNGARGYSSLPYPSFSNIVIEPGAEKKTGIMSGISRGILVEQFIGLGQSNTLTGDFSAGLDLAYLIENGEIAGRVKDCMISDNLFRLLAGEFSLSAERERIGAVLAPHALFPSVNYTG